jgi:hypothetical protein
VAASGLDLPKLVMVTTWESVVFKEAVAGTLIDLGLNRAFQTLNASKAVGHTGTWSMALMG